MANIDKNPKQIAYLRHQTQTMLEGLVREGDGTTQLLLDPSNTDQGFISYTPPTEIGEEDDYFSFDSLNYSVQLPLEQDGKILVNTTGFIYNVSMRLEGQDTSCSYELYINFPWGDYIPDSESGHQLALVALLNTILADNYKLVASGVLNSINPDMHNGIVLTVQAEDGPNDDIRVTYLDLDTKETAQLVILLPLASIREVHCSPAM